MNRDDDWSLDICNDCGGGAKNKQCLCPKLASARTVIDLNILEADSYRMDQ